MKKKFKMMMMYFNSTGLDDIYFEFDAFDTNIEYVMIDAPFTVATQISNIFEEIIEMYIDKCVEKGLDGVYHDSMSDYYRISGKIYPKKGIVEFEDFDYTYYGEENTEEEYLFEDYNENAPMYERFIKIRDFLKQENIEEVTIQYQGSGDDGYVESEYQSPSGGGNVPDDIETICYQLLENFGGWEINEGSSGNINLSDNKIIINHSWNTEERETNSINIEVSINSFSE